MSSEITETPSTEESITDRRLRVVFAGGHGQIALLAQRRLAAEGHQPIGLIRTPEYADELRAFGAEPVIFDLENQTAAELAELIKGADALVFAAGAGPNSGPARKMTVDRDGAILLADAAELAGIRRYVVISALAADDFVVGSEEVFQIYLRAKAEADEIVRSRDLDWTIVRPGGLTDDGGHWAGPARREHRSRSDPTRRRRRDRHAAGGRRHRRTPAVRGDLGRHSIPDALTRLSRPTAAVGRWGASSTRYMAARIAPPPMIIRPVRLSPPKTTANAAAQTGSMAMITAARDASTRAWAQVCSSMVSAPAISAR